MFKGERAEERSMRDFLMSYAKRTLEGDGDEGYVLGLEDGETILARNLLKRYFSLTEADFVDFD